MSLYDVIIVFFLPILSCGFSILFQQFFRIAPMRTKTKVQGHTFTVQGPPQPCTSRSALAAASRRRYGLQIRLDPGVLGEGTTSVH